VGGHKSVGEGNHACSGDVEVNGLDARLKKSHFLAFEIEHGLL